MKNGKAPRADSKSADLLEAEKSENMLEEAAQTTCFIMT